MVARSNRVARSTLGRGILVREFRVSFAIWGGEYHCEYHLLRAPSSPPQSASVRRSHLLIQLLQGRAHLGHRHLGVARRHRARHSLADFLVSIAVARHWQRQISITAMAGQEAPEAFGARLLQNGSVIGQQRGGRQRG